MTEITLGQNGTVDKLIFYTPKCAIIAEKDAGVVGCS